MEKLKERHNIPLIENGLLKKVRRKYKEES